MSKTFVPQFSPGESPGEFSPVAAAGESPPILPLEWAPLQMRESALRWEQALKEKEERLLKQSREKALLVEKEAYEKGFAQGEKDGMELVHKKLETVLESFKKIVAGMARVNRELGERDEEEMVRMIFALTRKIARHEPALPESAVRETLRAAFRQVIEPRGITLRVNPKDHQYLIAHPGDLPWNQHGAGGVKIVADPSITRGGCSLDTSYGEIDATLEGQLDQILSAAGLPPDRDPPSAPPSEP